MKRSLIALSILLSAAAAHSSTGYVAPTNTAILQVTGNSGAGLPSGDCIGCHSQPPLLNSFGNALANAGIARGYGGGDGGGWLNPPGVTAVTAFVNMIEDVKDQDSDGDGASNLAELNAKTNPGDASSGGGGSSSESSSGEPEFLAPRNLGASGGETSETTLSGCGVAMIDSKKEVRTASLQKYGSSVLFLLPVLVLAFLYGRTRKEEV